MFYAPLAYPVWTGRWVEEEAKKGFLAGVELAKEGFLVGSAKGKTGFQFHPVKLIQTPCSLAVLSGFNHQKMNSGQASPAVWTSEFGSTAIDIFLANSKVLKKNSG